MKRMILIGMAMLVLGSTTATADPLPISRDQFDRHLTALSGGGRCTSSGSYDSDTLFWEQRHSCGDDFEQLYLESGERYDMTYQETLMAAFVNSDGDVLGGAFTWTAAIPELGFVEPTLLGFGTVIGAFYGQLFDDGGISFQALLEFEFLAEPLTDIGPFVEWVTYIDADWPGCQLGMDTCEPWTVHYTYGNSDNYTGSNFLYFDGGLLVPEPGTLALLGIGLAGLGLARRRRKV